MLLSEKINSLYTSISDVPRQLGAWDGCIGKTLLPTQMETPVLFLLVGTIAGGYGTPLGPGGPPPENIS